MKKEWSYNLYSLYSLSNFNNENSEFYKEVKKLSKFELIQFLNETKYLNNFDNMIYDILLNYK